MRTQKCSFGPTMAALLTAVLTALPEVAAASSSPSGTAAGQADPDPAKKIRFDRATPSPKENAGTKLSPFALRLFGGYGRAEVGDLNEGLDGYFELFEIYRALGAGTTTGGYNPLRHDYNAGADLILQISPRIGIGVGAGYMRFSKTSRMTWSRESESFDLSNTSTLSAIPLRLGLFLTFPLGDRLNLNVGAAAVAYADLKLEANEHIDSSDGDRVSEESLSARRPAPRDNIGFQGSLGFEFKIFPNTGLFIEALGRYARFGNFKTATGWYGASEENVDTNEGRLYLARFANPLDWEWSYFCVAGSPPVSDPPRKIYEEPKIDLNGISIQAGLRIRL